MTNRRKIYQVLLEDLHIAYERLDHEPNFFSD